MDIKYDVIIIGSGPIGLTCAIEAEKLKMKYLVIEKGCLVNSTYNYPVNMTFFSTSEKLEIGDVPFISHGAKPTRREALEYFRRVKQAWNLKVNVYEKVEKIEGEKNNFKIVTSKSTYRAKNIIISTGFYDSANRMYIPGEELPKVRHYYKEPHPYIDQKIIVVGGGNSGIDVALETFRCGADVTMVIRRDSIDDSVKYWVKPDIENRIKENSIKSYFNSHLSAIREKEVDIETPKGKVTIENDYVLAMTGYHPDFDFLKAAGVKLENNSGRVPIYNPDTFETNVKGIFLAGVVNGGMNTGMWFIENSRYHAVNIFEYLSKEKKVLKQKTSAV